jgi:hypothetical protein
MIDFNNLLARIVAVQQEIITGSKAYAYYLHTQSDMPYWINRVDNVATSSNSEDFDKHVVQVEMVLVSAQRTEGYAGESEHALYERVPLIIEGFNNREGLTSVAYPAYMDDLEWALITNTRPFVILENSGVGSDQIVAVFTLTCTFDTYST